MESTLSSSGYKTEKADDDSSSSSSSSVEELDEAMTEQLRPVEKVNRRRRPTRPNYKEISESEEESSLIESHSSRQYDKDSDSDSDCMELIVVKKTKLVSNSNSRSDSCFGSFNTSGSETQLDSETRVDSNISESSERSNGQWEIEKIRDYVKDDAGEWFHVKWKGWSDDFSSWEPRANLLNCDEELYRFYQERKAMYRIVQPRREGPTFPIMVPPDPRPYDIRVQEFFNGNGFMREGDILDLYAQWKSNNGSAKSRWSQAKIDKHIEQANDGLLSDDELVALKKQIVVLEIEENHKAFKKEIKEWERKINAITGGRPYITIENNVNMSRPPIEFEFVNDYVAGEGVEIPTDPPVGCQCASEGTSCYDQRNKKCCAIQSSCKFAYTRFGKVNVMLGSPIYECNSKCACGPDCPNRVVQDGKNDNEFKIFLTNDGRGWGVKTLKSIKKDKFVTLYVGEVIKSEEAERRGQIYDANGQTYLFDLDFNDLDDCPFSVDASKFGNVAHFINHSCSPNLGVYAVWVDCLDPNLPKLAMFALKDIARDEELTFDYDVKLSRSRSDHHHQEESNDEVPSVKTRCLCGTAKCRKFIF